MFKTNIIKKIHPWRPRLFETIELGDNNYLANVISGKEQTYIIGVNNNAKL